MRLDVAFPRTPEHSHKLSQIKTIATTTVVRHLRVGVGAGAGAGVRAMFIGWQIGYCANGALQYKQANTSMINQKANFAQGKANTGCALEGASRQWGWLAAATNLPRHVACQTARYTHTHTQIHTYILCHCRFIWNDYGIWEHNNCGGEPGVIQFRYFQKHQYHYSKYIRCRCTCRCCCIWDNRYYRVSIFHI